MVYSSRNTLPLFRIWRDNARSVSYKKVSTLLLDTGKSKTQLINAAKHSTNAMATLGNNEDVRVETLVKICGALGCTMDDIMELIQDPQ